MPTKKRSAKKTAKKRSRKVPDNVIDYAKGKEAVAVAKAFGVQTPRASPMTTVGVGGTAFDSGYIRSHEKDARLRGTTRYQTYSNTLANTPIVAGSARFFLNLLAKAKWSLEPADESPQALEIAEAIEAMLHDMTTPWHRVVRRSAMYRFYGYSVSEWTAKRRDDGLIGLLDIEPRPQITIERWDVDETGTVLGMIQRSPQTQVETTIPRGKTLYVVDDSLNDSPEGLGLFRHVVDGADRLADLQRHEVQGFEADMRGMPVGRIPKAAMDAAVLANDGTMTEAQRDAAVAKMELILQNRIRSPSRALWLDSQTWQTTDDKQAPSNVPMWDIDILKAESDGLEQIGAAITRIEKELALLMGTDHLLLGLDGAGSLALSRDKSHNFGLIVDSTLKELTEAVEADLFVPLMRLNGWPEELTPTAKTEQAQFRDIEQITGALDNLGRAGAPMLPTDPAVPQVYDLLGLSPPPQEDLEEDAALRPTPEPEPEEDDTVPEVEDEAAE